MTTFTEEPLTIKLAHEQHLDVYTFAETAQGTRTAYACGKRARGYEVQEFEETVQGTKLLLLAVRPLPGRIAPEMKARKVEKTNRALTVREFIENE